MRKLFCLILLCSCLVRIFPDSAYKIDLEKDLFIGTAALDVLIMSFFFMQGSEDRQHTEQINRLDDKLSFNYNRSVDNVSTVFAVGVSLVPFSIIAFNGHEWGKLPAYLVMYAESFFLTLGTAESMKNGIARMRPYTYHESIPAGKEDTYYKSFPSAHTAYSFGGAGFLTSILLSDFPDSKWSIPAIAVSYLFAASTGAMRILSGEHFFTDVLAGAALGSLYGYGIPLLHKIKKSSGVDLTLAPAGFSVKICR
jgi:undecaprenyl-diphosphatase